MSGLLATGVLCDMAICRKKWKQIHRCVSLTNQQLLRVFDTTKLKASTVFDGKLDILVNNVGTSIRRATVDYTPEEFKHVMDTNFNSLFLLTQVRGKEASMFRAQRLQLHCVVLRVWQQWRICSVIRGQRRDVGKCPCWFHSSSVFTTRSSKI